MEISKIYTMKQNKFLAVAIAIAITLVSCGEKKNNQDTKVNTSKEQTADIADASFSDGMTSKVFHNYQQMRLALVNSDVDGVQKAADLLAESFSEERDKMKLTALAIAEANDLEKQRELFSLFTKKVEPLFKESISEGTIYKQFCPMVFEGKGGYWISNIDEIRNPYYGEKMLKCGKVTEIITQ
jgi:hypothetical protein